jgi:hypothetical protein
MLSNLTAVRIITIAFLRQFSQVPSRGVINASGHRPPPCHDINPLVTKVQ